MPLGVLPRGEHALNAEITRLTEAGCDSAHKVSACWE